MISITNPVNISTPAMTNMGIMAAGGRTKAAAIGCVPLRPESGEGVSAISC